MQGEFPPTTWRQSSLNFIFTQRMKGPSFYVKTLVEDSKKEVSSLTTGTKTDLRRRVLHVMIDKLPHLLEWVDDTSFRCKDIKTFVQVLQNLWTEFEDRDISEKQVNDWLAYFFFKESWYQGEDFKDLKLVGVYRTKNSDKFKKNLWSIKGARPSVIRWRQLQAQPPIKPSI